MKQEKKNIPQCEGKMLYNWESSIFVCWHFAVAVVFFSALLREEISQSKDNPVNQLCVYGNRGYPLLFWNAIE